VLRNITLKTLRDQRRSLIWWTVGIVVLVGYTMLFYPSIRDNQAYQDFASELPESFTAFFGGDVDPTSPEGYLTQQLYSFILPLLLAIYAINAGTRAIAGEEDRGTLELLVAQPVSRSRVTLEKFAAMVIGTLFLGAVMEVTVLAINPLVDMGLDLGTVTAATVATVLFGLVFGSLALALGAATGRRSTALGVPAALAIAAYLLDSLGQIVDGLGGVRKASPFYLAYGNTPLIDGLAVAQTLALVAIVVVLVPLGMAGFARRDIAT
jgi:ABC-2 type transport system permease protein